MPLRSDKTTWFGVVLGAPDAAALADFYARLLGWQVFPDAGDDGFVSVAPDETSARRCLARSSFGVEHSTENLTGRRCTDSAGPPMRSSR